MAAAKAPTGRPSRRISNTKGGAMAKGAGRSRGKDGQKRIGDRKPAFTADDESQPYCFSTSTIRRLPVDPDTKQYFVQLSGLVGEGGTVADPEERATLSANALEEAAGKELHLACDAACSRVLESLLLTSDVKHLLDFCRGCSSSFAYMSMDFAGSHVADAVLQAIMLALRNGNITREWYSALESALESICQVMAQSSLDVMCSRYGSHVLRNLLAVCSGISLDSAAGQGKPASILASRLSLSSKARGAAPQTSAGFPKLVHPLVKGILEKSKEKIWRLHGDSAAGPVLQAVLKVLKGDSDAVTMAISALLECNQENLSEEGRVLESASAPKILESMQDRNSSHLFEVMLQVVPDGLFMEMFLRFFRQNLLELSHHESANFIVQTLISAARHEGQVNMILDKLEGHFLELIKERRAGVIAALVAACGRFRTRQREVCRILAHAVNPKTTASKSGLVLQILHLENLSNSDGNYRASKRMKQAKLSVLGSAILQTIFSFPMEYSQQYATSMIALPEIDAVETVKDPGGCRVVEAFLASAAPAKLKQRCIAKFKGHFAELAMHPVSSYTVEKCFSASDLKLKEAMVSELAQVQSELSKTKHGPFLLKRCDVAIFAKAPEQWKSRESSKQGTRAAFAELFTDGASEVANGEKSGKVSKEDRGNAAPKLAADSNMGSEKRERSEMEGGNKKALSLGSVASVDAADALTKQRGQPKAIGNGKDGLTVAEEQDREVSYIKKKRKKRKGDKTAGIDPVTGKMKKQRQMMFC